jgi:hypothetical protein
VRGNKERVLAGAVVGNDIIENRKRNATRRVARASVAGSERPMLVDLEVFAVVAMRRGWLYSVKFQLKWLVELLAEKRLRNKERGHELVTKVLALKSKEVLVKNIDGIGIGECNGS